MGIDIQIYLTEVSLPSSPPALIFSLSLSLFESSRQKPLHVTGANRRGLTRKGCAGSEKEFASRSLFFSSSSSSFSSTFVDTRADLERKPRRQMRARYITARRRYFGRHFLRRIGLDLSTRDWYRVTRSFEQESWSRLYNRRADFHWNALWIPMVT